MCLPLRACRYAAGEKEDCWHRQQSSAILLVYGGVRIEGLLINKFCQELKIFSVLRE